MFIFLMATVVCLGHSCFPTKITVDQCRMYTTDMTFQIVCGGKWFLAKMTTMRDSFYVLFSMSFNNLSSFCCFPTQFTSPDTVHTGVLLVTFHGRAYIRARNLPTKKNVFIWGWIKRKIFLPVRTFTAKITAKIKNLSELLSKTRA